MNTVTLARVVATGFRNALHFGDYTEQYDRATVTYFSGYHLFTVDVEATSVLDNQQPQPLTEQEQQQAHNTNKVYRWLLGRTDRKNLKDANSDPVKGDRVQVFRGKKVPKGEYTVTNAATGNYGPYVDLRDDAGKVYRFVSRDNVRPLIASDTVSVLLRKVSDNIARNTQEKLAELVSLLPILADAVQDCDHQDEFFIGTNDELATLLRELAEGYRIEHATREERYNHMWGRGE